MHDVPYFLHLASYAVHQIPYCICPMSTCTMSHHLPCTTCIKHHIPYAICCVSYAMHVMTCTICCAPYTICHHVPYIIQHMSCGIVMHLHHVTPYVMHHHKSYPIRFLSHTIYNMSSDSCALHPLLLGVYLLR